ncbi:hypothetical protein [Caballeronia sp. AZ10_KS36]|nr:hypothetical protein [Caballeronia sp. AZ10_KS36]
MAIVSNGVCIVIGAFKIGVVTELLCEPVPDGYLSGIPLALVTGSCLACW